MRRSACRQVAIIGCATAMVLLRSTQAAAGPVLCPGNLWYPGGVCPSPTPATPQPAPEPPRAGAAADVSGDVTFVYPDGRRIAASPGVPVPIGAEVITGPSGSLKILLLDETVFTVGPNSEMTIDDFVYDPDTSTSGFLATLTKGLFRFVAGHLSHNPERWRVNTPSGSLGIRGTTFDVTANPDGSGDISVEEGEVVLTEYDTGKEWVVDAGQKLVIENFQIVGLQ